MKGNYNIFYTPEKQYPDMPHGEMCGDFMPFYWKGTYYLFYLYKYCVYVTETKDFVKYGKPYLALQNGSPSDQDWHIGTGSVFCHDDTFYFHYTGFCKGNNGEEGKNEQVVMRAVSKDLKNWTKDPEFFFKPDTRYYENTHWRDPHVIWNEEIGKFCMIITATQKGGAKLRNGCTAVFVSDDVRNWEHYETLYSPRTFITHECHDAFKIGEDWYLSFSNYSRWWETRYRMAKSFNGPYMIPQKDDMFDGRQFYAAKTVTDGNKYYMVGWQAARQNCDDKKGCIWGGNALVHEIIQREDKTLGVGMVKEIEESFDKKIELDFEPCQGTFTLDNHLNHIKGTVLDGFGWAKAGNLKDTCLFEAVISWTEGTHAVGLMIHTDSKDLNKWVQLRLEVTHGRILIDHYKKVDGSQLYLEERPIEFRNHKTDVKVIVSGSVILVYVDDVALASRCYDISTGAIGVFAEYGEVICSDIKLMEQSEVE